MQRAWGLLLLAMGTSCTLGLKNLSVTRSRRAPHNTDMAVSSSMFLAWGRVLDLGVLP